MYNQRAAGDVRHSEPNPLREVENTTNLRAFIWYKGVILRPLSPGKLSHCPIHTYFSRFYSHRFLFATLYTRIPKYDTLVKVCLLFPPDCLPS